jgi:pyruvate/2-oxoglutarate dehydrogenase complex dihydrolipoamide acyltransferase (E2) component
MTFCDEQVKGGVVKKVHAAAGDNLAAGDLVLVVDEEDEEDEE